MHDPRCVLCKLGRGGLRQNTTDFTKFITLTTCFGRCGPSSGHKSTGKIICSVQTYVVHQESNETGAIYFF